MVLGWSGIWVVGNERNTNNADILPYRTLIHVEADAKMDSYEAKDGTSRIALNLLMRKLVSESIRPDSHIELLLGQFEALSRPQNRQGEEGAPAQAAASG